MLSYNITDSSQTVWVIEVRHYQLESKVTEGIDLCKSNYDSY